MLPLPPAITSQLDKASIIRLTISYLKLREFTLHGDPPWPRDMSNNKSLKGTCHCYPVTTLCCCCRKVLPSPSLCGGKALAIVLLIAAVKY
ncbi:Protein trachealess [Portunus trituberculatus]|uniref:Protein trachealess n=1 Tax=Portunus trituberculatus TaxID=210409 RepID=A0A5B7KDK4_PORTR|nr:Protein trachealess [Portunus trituberculatus]